MADETDGGAGRESGPPAGSDGVEVAATEEPETATLPRPRRKRRAADPGDE